MEWSIRRRLAIIIGILALLAALSGYGFFRYQSQILETCTDGLRNGDETGVDCGGSCVLACFPEQVPIQSLWVKPVRVTGDVYHVVAAVENHNRAIAARVPYHISLYDGNNILISERDGVTTLPANQQSVIVEYGITTDSRVPTFAFITIDAPGSWLRAPDVLSRTILSVREPVWSERPNGTTQLSAVVRNTSDVHVDNATIYALAYDSTDTVIAVSSTTVLSLDPSKDASIAFTWPTSITPERTQFIVMIDPFRQSAIELLTNPLSHS